MSIDLNAPALETHAATELIDAGTTSSTTLADVLAELKRIRHVLGLAQALAVGEKDLARLLGISPATLARWKSSGRLLPGIRQGGRILYVLDGPSGVRAWLEAGMPDVKSWTAMTTGA